MGSAQGDPAVADRSARRAALKRGADGEARIAQILVDQGWTVLARNWTGGGGELDLVAQKDGEVRFVEVKTRSSGDFVGLEVITPAKQRKLSRAAGAWLDRFDGPVAESSFSIAYVEPGGVTWIDDAFDEV